VLITAAMFVSILALVAIAVSFVVNFSLSPSVMSRFPAYERRNE
jgi:hypothetical protein